MNSNLCISVLGCGWYGLALAKSLVREGFIVKGSTTSAEKLPVLEKHNIQAHLVNLTPGKKIYNDIFFDCDVLWVAIPPKSRSQEGENYLEKITAIIHFVKKHQIKKLVYISSTGVYGDHNCDVDERTPPAPISKSGKILLQAEDMLRAETGITATIIRFGGLIGPGRNPGRFFAGKTNIPNGKAPVNLIHLDDCLGISLAVLEKNAFGYTINACSPQHPAKADFYIKAAKTAGLEKPGFIDELLEWKIINSVYIKPLLKYQFKTALV